MTTQTKIVLKPLLELEAEINSGKTAIAAGVNHGEASVRLLSPGRYITSLEIRGTLSYLSEDDETHTLAQFLDSIPWDSDDELSLELKVYLDQSIWFTDTYDAPDPADIWGSGGWHIDPRGPESFVWPEDYVESIDVIHATAAQAKANRDAVA